MSRLTVEGGFELNGTVSATGAKNAVLPLLAASIMFEGETQLHNVPYLMDVSIMIRMLNALGLRAELHHENVVKISNTRKVRHIAPYDLVTSMRASFFVAGPILAKTGMAKVPLPGGCSIGSRPVDLHLKAFEALGAKINMEHGFVHIQADKLVGAEHRLEFPSVGATENMMMAACLAEGVTILRNAAREPEIEDLGNFLNAAGAKVSGHGSSEIRIEGVPYLRGVKDYHVIPDRVEIGTLLIAGAITGGEVSVRNVKQCHMGMITDLIEQAGFPCVYEDNKVTVKKNGRPKAVDFETKPFPGYPTDMQAQMMSLLTIATGKSVIKESIFENRFMHAQELIRMGAKIDIDKNIAVVHGVEHLSGADVKITDLRAGAALILAGLVAKGHTTVYGLKHLRRGYDDLEGKLRSLGAKIVE